jgi:hypothetical protein
MTELTRPMLFNLLHCNTVQPWSRCTAEEAQHVRPHTGHVFRQTLNTQSERRTFSGKPGEERPIFGSSDDSPYKVSVTQLDQGVLSQLAPLVFELQDVACCNVGRTEGLHLLVEDFEVLAKATAFKAISVHSEVKGPSWLNGQS